MKNLIGLINAICDTYDCLDLQPKDGQTFCNVAAQRVALALGCRDLDNKTADQMYTFLELSDDWSEIPMEKAQGIANDGSFVVAVSDSKTLGQNHGHVCVIRPGIPSYSGKWGQVPRVMNIGAQNFIGRAKQGPLVGMQVGLNEAFIPLPKIFVWRNSL